MKGGKNENISDSLANLANVGSGWLYFQHE
jgi:hypothetical protein